MKRGLTWDIVIYAILAGLFLLGIALARAEYHGVDWQLYGYDPEAAQELIDTTSQTVTRHLLIPQRGHFYSLRRPILPPGVTPTPTPGPTPTATPTPSPTPVATPDLRMAFICDNTSDGVTVNGSWTTGSATGGTGLPGKEFYGKNYIYSNVHNTSTTVEFRPPPLVGDWEVSVMFRSSSSYSSSVKIEVWTEAEIASRFVDMQHEGGNWKSLGVFVAPSVVKITTMGSAAGYVIADAVQFVPTKVAE